jgi:ferric-dicitrate binding protein FerR (iron transport regulator)
MEKEYPDLIIKYLQRNLSNDETKLFYNWINSDKENKKLFFEIKAIYDETFNYKKIDIEKSWVRLLDKRNNKNTFLYSLRQNIFAYAAVAIVAALLSSVFFWFAGNNFNRRTLSSQYVGGNGLEADIVILSDGTKVSLGSNTKFRYEDDYGKLTRTVFLEGEAYFDIVEKREPFIVKIDGQNIEALGTKFNVMAYPSDSVFVTTLLEGSVRLTTNNSTQSIILKPDQQIIYNRNTYSFKISKVYAEQVIAWTTGYYYFSDQRLEAILHRLSLIYGVSFNVNSERLKNMVFSGAFYRGQSMKDIMEIINMSIPIKYEINDQQIKISELRE